MALLRQLADLSKGSVHNRLATREDGRQLPARGWLAQLNIGPELVLPARMQVASEARGETQTPAKPVQLRLPAPLSRPERMEKGSLLNRDSQITQLRTVDGIRSTMAG